MGDISTPKEFMEGVRRFTIIAKSIPTETAYFIHFIGGEHFEASDDFTAKFPNYNPQNGNIVKFAEEWYRGTIARYKPGFKDSSIFTETLKGGSGPDINDFLAKCQKVVRTNEADRLVEMAAY